MEIAVGVPSAGEPEERAQRPASLADPDLEAARRGDAQAFTALHDRYAPMVHAVVLARVPRHDAEDIVQEVFLTALRKLHQVRDPRAFGGWLCAIARNRVVDLHRRPRATRALPEELPAPEGREVEAREVLAAIRELPSAYCETLLMRLVEGMTGPEIAKATGLTPGSVRVNLHRGMKLLRERLDSSLR